MIDWLFLIYKIPREPSSKRVCVWRKIKKIGALKLQDAVFALPYSERNLEKFQKIAQRITEIEGEVTIWKSCPVSEYQEEALIKQFNENINNQYNDILQRLDKMISIADICEKTVLLQNITAEYTEIKRRDYFNADLSVKIDEILTQAR